MKLPCYLTQKIKIYKQAFSNINEELLSNELASIQWQDVFGESQNVNQLFEVFFSKCSEIVNVQVQVQVQV